MATQSLQILSEGKDKVIVYCNPYIHGYETYMKVLEALCKACHEYNIQEQHIPLVFILTTQ
jgi:predicted adenine nucleotide alpha hydrolase (AANH) superfamily ATPase